MLRRQHPRLRPAIALTRFLLCRHLTSSLLGPWRQNYARLRALKHKWPLPPGQWDEALSMRSPLRPLLPISRFWPLAAVDGLGGGEGGLPGPAAPTGGKRKRQSSPEGQEAVEVLEPGQAAKEEDEDASDAENSRWRPWLSRLLPAGGGEADAGGGGGGTEAWICSCHWVPPGSAGSK